MVDVDTEYAVLMLDAVEVTVDVDTEYVVLMLNAEGAVLMC